jgi:hypothetical protein
MRLNHPDYIKLVTEEYKRKRTDRELSLLLAQSSPAKIRQACLHLYKEYYDKKDERLLKKDQQALRDFFGPAEHGRQFLQQIHGFETDRFRPLDYYLKGKNENTDDKNIELLAWLIDFKHRPFVTGTDVILSEEEIDILRESESNPGEKATQSKPEQIDLKHDEETLEAVIADEEKKSLQASEDDPVIITENSETLSTPNSINKPPKKMSKKILLIFLCLLISFAGIYIVLKYDSSTEIPYKNAKTKTVRQEDAAHGAKTDSLIAHSNESAVAPTNANKKKIFLPTIVLDSSHCLAITKKGTQCKRKAKTNGYCWQHGNSH